MPRPFRTLPWSVLLVAGVTFATAGLYVNSQLEQRRAAEEQKLLAIADLKAGEVERWRANLERHASALARRSSPARAAEGLLAGRGEPSELSAVAMLDEIADAERYDAARLVAPDGRVLAASDRRTELAPSLRELALLAMAERRIRVAEPLDDGPALRLVTAVPVNGRDGRLVASIVLETAAEAAVLGDVRPWPVPSATGEIRVVRRGSAALPAAGAGALLTPSALAARGVEGVVRTEEADGRSVVAVLRPIAASDWVLVASVDSAEVDGPVWALAGQVAATAISVVVAAAAGLALAARRRAVEVRAREAADARAREMAEQAKLLASAMDALRASEAQFRLLATHVPAGIFQVDAAGDCVYANATLREMLGLQQATLGAGWREAIHPADRARVDAEWRRDWSEGRTFRSEHRLVVGGDPRWVYVAAMPLRSGPGAAASGGIGIVADVTEAKRLQAQLSRAQRLAAVGALAAGMAHELNSPLASVLANARFALAELRTSSAAGRCDAAEALEDAIEATQRAASAVRHLQVFSRSGAGSCVAANDPREALAQLEEELARA